MFNILMLLITAALAGVLVWVFLKRNDGNTSNRGNAYSGFNSVDGAMSAATRVVQTIAPSSTVSKYVEKIQTAASGKNTGSDWTSSLITTASSFLNQSGIAKSLGNTISGWFSSTPQTSTPAQSINTDFGTYSDFAGGNELNTFGGGEVLGDSDTFYWEDFLL